jgi:hypothetical protein
MGNCSERDESNSIKKIIYSIPINEPSKGESSIYRNPVALNKNLTDFKDHSQDILVEIFLKVTKIKKN